MNRKYISAVKPLDNYILQVDFVSGSRLLLDMKPYLDKLRFRPLAEAQLVEFLAHFPDQQPSGA